MTAFGHVSATAGLATSSRTPHKEKEEECKRHYDMEMESKRTLDYTDGFTSYMQSGTDLSQRTRELYTCELTLFARNLENPLLNDLSLQTLLAWNQMLYDAGAAANTMAVKHNALRRFLSYLEKFDNSDHARQLLRVVKDLQTPRDRELPGKPFVLEEEQVTKMLDAAGKAIGRGPRDRAVIHVLGSGAAMC